MSMQTQPAAKAARPAGIPQGATLVASAWVAAFASAALLGPVLPRMTQHFSAAPSVDVMIALVATLPALFVALLSVPFGALADRVGHRRVLFWACLFYGVIGIAPFWLQSLTAIVISRGLVGIAEAAIMTCSAALIGHYFSGVARAHWYALQSGTAPLAAIVAIVLGGMLGEASWHGPFLVYSFGFVLFILVATLLWEPQWATNAGSKEEVSTSAANWPRLLRICAITLFAMSAFLVTVIQTSFLLTERGITLPRTIGLWQGVSALANALGAVAFGVLPWRHIAKVVMSLLLMAAGFGVIALQPSWQAAVVGAVIANLGCGMILPTLITWALSGVPAGMRGKGAGAWMCASFLGQFFSPLTIVWLKSLTGSLSKAILSYSIACALGAGMGALGLRRSSAAQEVEQT